MICWISWIHWPSFLLGVVALFLLECILAIILIMKFFRNKKDPIGEEKIVQSLTEEYGDNAKGSK